MQQMRAVEPTWLESLLGDISDPLSSLAEWGRSRQEPVMGQGALAPFAAIGNAFPWMVEQMADPAARATRNLSEGEGLFDYRPAMGGGEWNPLNYGFNRNATDLLDTAMNLQGFGSLGKAAFRAAPEVIPGLLSKAASDFPVGGLESSIWPGRRAPMLKARKAELAEREAQSVGAERALSQAEQDIAAGKRAQRTINIANVLDEPGPTPDLSGYDLFDYSKLGEDVGEVYSLLRPQPAQSKFERLPEHLKALVSDPYVYRGMEKAVERGRGYWPWYDIRQYADSLLGEGMTTPELNRYLQYQQAAAQNLGPEMQKRVGNYLWSLDKAGKLESGAPMSFPTGYGSKAQKNIWENALDIAAGRPIESEKLLSYGENYGTGLLLGEPTARLTPNWGPGTMDTHGVRLPAMLSHNPSFLIQQIREKKTPGFDMERWAKAKDAGDFVAYSPRESYQRGTYPISEALQRPGHWYSVPSGSGYGAIEQYLYKPIAEKLGIPTASAQAGAWVGGGGITGLRAQPKLMLQMYEDEIRRLAERYGITPAAAIKGIARGELY